MKTLSVNSPEVIEAYYNASASEKKIFTKLFGAIGSNQVKDLFEAFLKENNIKHTLPHSYEVAATNDLKKGENAFSMLQIIIDTENKGVDPKKRIWFPVFKDADSGGGFSRSVFDLWDSRSGVGSRLCSETEKRSDDIAQKYQPIYNEYLNRI